MKKTYILCVGMLITLSLFSQTEINWQKTIGGSSHDKISSLKKTSDSGYIIGGTSISNISGDKTENSNGGEDYWIVKLDALGNIQWQNTIGGNNNDGIVSMTQTTDGGFIIGGYSNSNISGDKIENTFGGNDYWIIKTDSLGNIQWQNTIGGSGGDTFYSLQQTTDGGYILGGTSNSNISGDKTENSKGLYDYWIVKIDPLGGIQWQKTIGGSNNDEFNELKQTSDGGYILGGSSLSNISGDKTQNTNGLRDYWIVKIDELGNIEWQNSIGGSGNDHLHALHQTYDNGFIIGGFSESNISGDKTEDCIGAFDYWIVKTDSLGTIQWQNTIGGSWFDYLYSIELTNDSGYILGGKSSSGISGDKTENGNGNSDYWILKLDSIGNIQWQETIGGSDTDELFCIAISEDANYILGGNSQSNISGDKSENSKGFMDYWIINLRSKLNIINGITFIDFNTNLSADSGDIALTNHKLAEVISGRITYSQGNGIYYLNVLDTGNFSVSPSPLLHYTSVPASHSAYFSVMNQTDSLNDFAFQPNGVINDLQVTLNPAAAFRPGFDAHYNIHYKNVGTTSISGSVIFKPDNILTFISSTTTPTSVTIDSVVWNIPTLNPFDEGNILVTVSVSTGAVLGSTVNSFARIEPVAGDAIPADNESTWPVTVTGSYDPNDILVNRETVTTTELISPPYLDYLIRFQNTGTDTAFTVKIKNPLPVNATLNTFEFLESSHPVELNYSNPEQLMWFQFDNILLPDSNTNELLSHGYVRYRIKPKSTLTVGDLIENSASIFFDFNAPIYTNTAVTEIVLGTSVPGIKNNFDFNFYPNPSTNEVNISFTLKEEKEIKIELYNSLGQVVKAISHQKFTSGKNQLNFSTENFSKGIYHIKFSVDESVSVKRLVKM